MDICDLYRAALLAQIYQDNDPLLLGLYNVCVTRGFRRTAAVLLMSRSIDALKSGAACAIPSFHIDSKGNIVDSLEPLNLN